MCSKFVFAALFLVAAVPVFPQSSPAAIESVWQVQIGGGVSGYHDDFFGTGIMEGPTVWIDVFPNRGPRYVHGFGVEMVGHDISFGGPQPQPASGGNSYTTREDTFGGGPIYHWRHFKNFTPYGKFLCEQGSIDFNVNVSNYKHDNRTLYAVGAGFDYKLVHHISFRADFEKQWWQRLFQNHSISTPTGIAIEPRGLTLGAVYEFDRIHFRGSVKEK
jgi:opacity protein-like surface antigen